MSDCLSDESIAELVSGGLDDAVRAAALSHLDACEMCFSLVGALGRDTEPADEVADTIQRGSVLGRYVVLERIGAGSMGVVYAAFDSELERKVALKVLRSAGTEVQRTRKRLQREAKVMARLSHPNVAAVYDVGSYGEKLFIAMEYAEEGNLRDWMQGRAERGRSWLEVLRLFLQAGEGLAAAHQAGLIHRDFKPENVLIGKDGRCRVTDFGLAQQTTEALATEDVEKTEAVPVDATWMSRTGALIGTPAYMAPEQLAGQRADSRSDIYAFATALHEALYGKRPLANREVESLRRAALAEEFSPVSSDVPSRVRRALMRGLRARPADRFPSMRAMLDELSRARRDRRWVAAAGAATVLLAATLVWLAVRTRDVRPGLTPCTGSEEAFGDVWGGADKHAVQVMISRQGERGVLTFGVLDRELDAYKERWIEAHQEICRATHERHVQSDAFLELRTECLEHQRLAAKSLVRHLATEDPKVVDVAVQAAQSLEQPSVCKTARGQAASDDPAVRERAKKVAEAIANARPFEYLKSARDEVPDLEAAATEANAIGDRHLESQAWTTLGTLQSVDGHLDEGGRSMLKAIGPALAAGDDAALADAWTRLLWLEARAGRAGVAEAWGESARAAIEAMGGDEAREAEVLTHIAGLRVYVEWRLEEGAELATKARLAFLATRGPDYYRLAGCDDILGDAEIGRAHYKEAIVIHERALALRTRLFGAGSRLVFTSRINVAEAKLLGGDPQAGVDEYSAMIDFLHSRKDDNAYLLQRRAEGYRRLGKIALAIADDERSISLSEKGFGDLSLSQGLVGLGEDMIAARRPAEAIAPLDRALRLEITWADAQRGRAEAALAAALIESGDDRERGRTIATHAVGHLANDARRYGDWYEASRARAAELAKP